MPKGLLARSLIIIIFPLIALQLLQPVFSFMIGIGVRSAAIWPTA